MYAELSNFIKAICHPGGHWSWALRSPGTKRWGIVSPAPMWGKMWLLTVYTVEHGQQITKVRTNVSKWSCMLSRLNYTLKIIIIFFSFSITAFCLSSIPARCKHMFFRSAKALRGSASGFHLLGIMLWMSLCRYMFPFVSLWQKRMRS